jgi:hypothetical protein
LGSETIFRPPADGSRTRNAHPEPRERAEVPRDGVAERTFRRAARLGCQRFPQVRVIGVTPAVVLDFGADGLRHDVEVREESHASIVARALPGA